jgi:glycosyltransferase involved in cell wall biosynthesis
MKTRSKILIVVNSLEFFLSHRHSLAKEFIAQNYQVTVITDMGGKIKNDPDIAYIDFAIDRASINPFNIFLKSLRLRRLLLKDSYDVYYFASHKSNVLGGLASLLQFKIPTIFSISGLGYAFIDSRLKARLIKLVILMLYRIFSNQSKSTFVFQNNDDLKLFINYGVLTDKKAKIIPGMGVDLERFQFHIREKSDPKKPIKVLFAGRLLVDKGIEEFMFLASRLRKQNFEFHISGKLDAENPNAVDSIYFKQCLKEPNIFFHGYTQFDQMYKLYKATDIFLLPSYREGFPKAALEAAATGQPLLMSDVPGCRDCVENGFNGFLFELGNINSMEACLEKISDLNNYKYFSENSRHYVEKNFSSTYISSCYIDLIQSKEF